MQAVQPQASAPNFQGGLYINRKALSKLPLNIEEAKTLTKTVDICKQFVEQINDIPGNDKIVLTAGKTSKGFLWNKKKLPNSVVVKFEKDGSAKNLPMNMKGEKLGFKFTLGNQNLEDFLQNFTLLVEKADIIGNTQKAIDKSLDFILRNS